MTQLDQIAFDFIGRSRAYTSKLTLEADLKRTLSIFGIDIAAIVRVPSAGESVRPNIVFDRYPAEWTDYYARKNYVAVDPIFRYLRTGVRPKLWTDFPVEKGSVPWRLMREAAEFGLKAGLTIPVVSGRGQRFHVGLVSSTGEFRHDAVPALQLIGIFAHVCLHAILEEEEQRTSTRLPALTAREIECLKWTVAGKSRPEIGIILSIADSTVRFHLNSVAEKLGVPAQKAQIIAEAMRRRLIT